MTKMNHAEQQIWAEEQEEAMRCKAEGSRFYPLTQREKAARIVEIEAEMNNAASNAA
jgi:hypothetical protein